MRLLKWFVGLAAVVLVLAGCTATSPADEVKARSLAYWAAMKGGDYSVAYGFLSPGFRARVSKDAFAARFIGKTRWDGADLRSVNCEDERCVVTVDAQFTFLGNELFPTYSNSTQVEESWIREGSEWWLVPKR